MALADTFQQVVDSLPGDWTDLELDLRIDDESRYIDAALYLVTCNAQPYSRHDWHWRLLVAHSFGHAAAVPAVHGALKLLDDAGHHRRARACARCAAAASRSCRCGVARSPRARSSGACARSDGARRRAHPRPPLRLQGPVGARRPPATRSTSSPASSRRGTRSAASTCWSIDLTSPDVDGVELFETLATGGELHEVRSLGFFAHVRARGARARAAGGIRPGRAALADGARGCPAGRGAAGRRRWLSVARARET